MVENAGREFGDSTHLNSWNSCLKISRVRRVDAPALLKHYFNMSSLAEIEKAAAALSPQQKQELMLFLGARLRAERAGLPEPRQFSREQVQLWVAGDEADLKRFREPS
jgi:hypothetical protein